LLDAPDEAIGSLLLQAIDERAASVGYLHLMARLTGPQYVNAWSLERNNYHLRDVGTAFICYRDGGTAGSSLREFSECRLRLMTGTDVAAVIEFGKSLFKLSYFYRDPFFGETEADRFHAEWISNLFCSLADAVWVCEANGKAVAFVTCEIKGSP